MKKPNILFIIADDHRYDAIGAYGNPIVKTPVLDSLAESGIAFHRAHVMGGLTGGLCAPCRAAIQTGVSVFRTSAARSLDDNKGLRTINPELALMPETFKQHGYHTYAIGKWHNDTASFSRNFQDGAKLFFGGMSEHDRVPLHDFDPSGLYLQENRYAGDGFSTDMFCDAAVRFLNRYDEAEKPFFLYVALTSPHDPRTPPGEYAHMYQPSNIPLPDSFLPEHLFDNGELRNRDERLAPWPRTPDELRRQTADYYGMVSHMDAQLGRVLEALRQREDGDRTIVVYTADHGIAIGRHGLMGKQNLYDHSIRVPLIIKGPGVTEGRTIDALVYSADLFPTLCELSGVAIPETVEMSSLVPLIERRRETVRDSVCAAYKDVQRSISDGRWKLIRYYRSAISGKGSDTLQLFNLEQDPSETANVANEPGNVERMKQLARRLTEWRINSEDPWAERPVLPLDSLDN